MTASEPARSPDRPPATEGSRSVAQRALDVLVYLPAGAFLAALEDVPETVARGHSRVDQELRNAKFVGRVAVELGWRELRGQLLPLSAGDISAKEETATEGGGRPDDEEAAVEPPTGARQRSAARDPEVDRAIPDYDILAASQVVRRLGGLGHEELRAVVRHEQATRGRRTVLLRAAQLLGTRPQDPAGRDAGANGPDGAA